MNIPLSPFAPPSSVSLLIPILKLNMVLTYGIPPDFRGGVHLIVFLPPYAMVSVPSLSGHAIAYQWRSLHYRESADTGPVNLKVVEFQTGAVLPWQVTMDQFICASLSHAHDYSLWFDYRVA